MALPSRRIVRLVPETVIPSLDGTRSLSIEAEDAGPVQLATFLSQLGGLRSLRHLAVRFNEPMVPPPLFELRQLHSLHLVSGNADRLPRALGNLDRLRALTLDLHVLGAVPPAIERLRRLRHLSIRSVVIEGLPPQIAELSELRALALWFCPFATGREHADERFSETLDLLADLEKLDELTLSRLFALQPTTRVAQHVPAELIGLRGLRILRLLGGRGTIALPLRSKFLPPLTELVITGVNLAHEEADIVRAFPQAYIAIGDDFRHGTSPYSVPLVHCPECGTGGMRLVVASAYELDVDQLSCFGCGGMFEASLLVDPDS